MRNNKKHAGIYGERFVKPRNLALPPASESVLPPRDLSAQ
jgi:hypothetical protein